MLFSRTLLPLFFLGALLAILGRCATTAIGSTAYISIASAPPFATMKPCAASCLDYKGSFACGVNAGYHDLGTELSCGCSPQNFCYCDAKAAASASSYISSCVSAECTAFPGEVTSALNLYNGYCATANAAAVVQTTAPDVAIQTAPNAPNAPASSSSSVTSPASKSTSSRTSSKSAGNTAQATSSSRTSETSAPEPTVSTTKKEGLTQSDVIALAVGLGVGVPSLLLALGTFCMQRSGKEKVIPPAPNVQYVRQY